MIGQIELIFKLKNTGSERLFQSHFAEKIPTSKPLYKILFYLAWHF